MKLSRWMLIGALAVSSGSALASDARQPGAELGYDDPHTTRSSPSTPRPTDPTIGYDDPETPRYARPGAGARDATLGYDDPHTTPSVHPGSPSRMAGALPGHDDDDGRRN